MADNNPRRPHPGQQYRHGWIPVTPAAAVEKNHGRKVKANSAISRILEEASAVHRRMQQQDADRKAGKTPDRTPSKGSPTNSAAAKANRGRQDAPAKADLSARADAAIRRAAGKGPKQTPTPEVDYENIQLPIGVLGVDRSGAMLRNGDGVEVVDGPHDGKTGKVVGSPGEGRIDVEADGKFITANETDLQSKPSAANSTKPAAQFSDAAVQARIRDAYSNLAREEQDWVSMTDVRKLLAGIPRKQQDDTLREMARTPGSGVVIAPEVDQKTLTKADWDAAVNIGGVRKHLLVIEPERFREAPKPDSVVENLQKLYGDRLQIHDETGRAHAREFAKVPEAIHRALASHVGQIDLGNGSVADYMPHARGMQPRGWPPGKTWADVPGGYDGNHRHLVAGGGEGTSHGSTSLVLHEGGHAVDDALGKASLDVDFVLLHSAATKKNVSPYFAQEGAAGLSEMWAEVFAAWVTNREEPPAVRDRKIGVAIGLFGDGAKEIGSRMASHFDKMLANLEA